ncbi:MAG: hypothetical protein GTN86_02030 [Xanthomonadales bacterium]|nr:hypothetical protein [Xanthomonadales bacterium]
MRTRVERAAPESGAMTVRIPLLEGESVLDRELSVEDGTRRSRIRSERRRRRLDQHRPAA